jgi:dTDP-L-rhamnose 4-epimerase
MKQKKWEPVCSCGKQLKMIATSETKPLQPNGIYAVTKTAQEQMTLSVCRAYGVPAVSLRYFNTYGPRQSLSNPYTGVAAIFISRIKNSHSPVIYEDGLQTRDFVSVHDITMANVLAMESNAADYEALNVGSGNATTIREVAEVLGGIYGKKIRPEITHRFRKGDVRHCFSDNSKIKRLLGYEPKVSFKEGIQELVEWSANKEAVDKTDKADDELKSKGLLE